MSLVDEFRDHFYASGAWQDTRYRGRQVLKPPTDLWAYREIIEECRPQLILEAGTHEGGSAVYFADCGRDVFVVTIDRRPVRVKHARVLQVRGDSTSEHVMKSVAGIVRHRRPERVMVVLDSDHRPEHVARELQIYAPLVSPGQHLVVEDTFRYEYNGRMQELRTEVVAPFLEAHPRFEVNERPERFGLTFHPGGWLRRRA